MTYETLTFLHDLLKQCTLRVGEPDFASTARSIIAALDELDKEIANADNSSGRDLPHPLPS